MALIRQRKLSKQQIRRINKQQTSIQSNEAEWLDGVVMAHYGKQLEVQLTHIPDSLPAHLLTPPTTSDNEPEPFWQKIQLGDIWRCHTRTNLPMLATGDQVRWIADPNTGLGRIERLEERTSLITRPDRYNKIKPVVANIDLLAIVFAPLPTPAYSLIDRYLVVAHHANVQPLLLLNKSDMLEEAQYPQVAQLLQDYEKLGYPSLLTRAISDGEHNKNKDGKNKGDGDKNSNDAKLSIEQLQQQIKDKLVVFVGQSGVGKSSLINSLLPNSQQHINVISENSQLGQHTTTTSRLLPFVTDDVSLAHGGIVDTPGIREYGIWHLSPADILTGFIELAPLADGCKFRDCKHTHNTKGCALRQAVKDDLVLERRVESLVQLQAEADTKDY